MPASNVMAVIGASARRAEDGLAAVALLTMAVLPVTEMGLRLMFRTGLPGASGYLQNLTLWVGLVGATIAARQSRHLNLTTGLPALPAKVRGIARLSASAVSAAITFGLAYAGLEFVRSEIGSGAAIGGWLPLWVAEAVLPASFAVIGIRFIATIERWQQRIGTCALALALAGLASQLDAAELLWPMIGGLIAAAFLGVPIFVLLGGAALLLFRAEQVPVAAIAVEAYRIVVSPSIPSLALFTLIGHLLAEGGASRRLVRLFRALFGWIPGGLAVATTLVCAFFTTFTGASGITILALGGLLLPVLVKNGYRENFSVGLLTATGSIGLLFPPSLAVIVYGVVANVSILDLFRAGMVPGLMMVAAVCVLGVREGLRAPTVLRRLEWREAAAALWDAKWELLLPAIILLGLFGGFGTLLETAALAVVYTLIVELVIHRELDLRRDVPRVLVASAAIVGGVFAILAAAMGLTNYLIDAEVPVRVAAWVSNHIDSRFVFLLVLNVLLLAVGCLMDIFSAIVLIVPLLRPVSESFGIHPLHLGMIFLVNLELGYLTPPVGMNLFLAAYRFERPLPEVCRNAIPFLLALLGVVLLVTYVPALTIEAGP